MLTIEEYKKILGDKLKGLTEEEIELWYRTHTTFISFILKYWLKSRGREEE